MSWFRNTEIKESIEDLRNEIVEIKEMFQAYSDNEVTIEEVMQVSKDSVTACLENFLQTFAQKLMEMKQVEENMEQNMKKSLEILMAFKDNISMMQEPKKDKKIICTLNKTKK